MATSVIGLVLVEATKKLTLPTETYWTDEFHHLVNIRNNVLQYPLLVDWMVLSTVRLKMEFVG